MSFIQKFFGYFDYGSGLEPYKDGLGGDAFTDWRFYLWVVAVIALAVGLYQVFKRHKKAGKITILVLVSLMLIVRTINQVVRACIGAENPWWRAIPFHMCTVLSFVLPLTIIFKWDKIKTPVFTLSLMGGIITLLVNDYFDNAFLTFSSIEGMLAHSILILVPIWSIAIGEFRIDYKKSWQTVVGVLVLMAWAMIANLILIYGLGISANYMYLMKNALPFGGDFYLLVYVAIFAVFMLAVFGIPELYRFIVRKKSQKNADTKKSA